MRPPPCEVQTYEPGAPISVPPGVRCKSSPSYRGPAQCRQLLRTDRPATGSADHRQQRPSAQGARLRSQGRVECSFAAVQETLCLHWLILRCSRETPTVRSVRPAFKSTHFIRLASLPDAEYRTELSSEPIERAARRKLSAFEALDQQMLVNPLLKLAWL